jgi:alpha/beta superfamily hydrolase
MSPPGRPKGEYRSAQHEGSPVSPPGRPKGEYRSAQYEGSPASEAAVHESALLFGPEDNLVGVVTPAAGAQSPVGVLILTAGVVHRIGPHRTSVKLARHLARLGYTCLRFDASGVGDSRVPADATSFRAQGVRDTRAAMDWLERERGIRAFALFGICSGAVTAYGTALEDERVVGAFMVDGYIYPTMKTRIVYYLAKLRALGPAKALILAGERARDRLARRFGSAVAKPATQDAPANVNPTAAEFAAGAQRLADRGVRLAFLFTGSVLHMYSYAGQLREAFRKYPFVGQAACHFEPDIDHTTTSLASQQRLAAMTADWVRSAAQDSGHTAPDGQGRPLPSRAAA